MALGMNVKLIDSERTRQMFGYDEIFQNLIKETNSSGVRIDPQALEITYGGAGSAGFAELGSAMTAEFNGSAFEKSTVLCTTRVLTPGGSYFYFYVISSTGTITQYYAWFSKYEVFTAKCLAVASITTGTYFTIQDSEASPTTYYVWMDKNGDGTTDDPSATGTGTACDISGATTADDVATIVAAAINGLAGFGASATTDTVTATCATKGDPTDAVDEDTGFTITVTENGGADPSASGTGAECDIKAATTAANVATIVSGVIDALSNVSAAASTATVTITNDEIGLVTAVTDGNTGYTITQLEQSADNYSGAPLYLISSSADDSDAITKNMRKATIIGYTPTELTEEEVALNGATHVKTSIVNWIREIHHGGSDWGSAGQDALGAVNTQNIDGTDYLVLTAAGNESEGGVIWIPNNFHAMIAELQLDLMDIAIAAVTDGAVVKIAKYGLDNTKNNRVYNKDPDHPNIPISATLSHPHTRIKWPEKTQMHGTDVAKLTISESLITTTVDFVFKAYVLIWYKEN